MTSSASGVFFDTVGPFVNVEFCGGPMDGELWLGLPWPPTLEILIPQQRQPLCVTDKPPDYCDLPSPGCYRMTDEQNYEKVTFRGDAIRAWKKQSVAVLMAHKRPRPMHYTWQG